MLKVAFEADSLSAVLEEIRAFVDEARESQPETRGSSELAKAKENSPRATGLVPTPALTDEQARRVGARIRSEAALRFLGDMARELRSPVFGPELFGRYGVAGGQAWAGKVLTPISKAEQAILGRKLIGWDPLRRTFTIDPGDAAVLDRVVNGTTPNG